MNIVEIEIQSFRSLINQKISFNERCLALIGLNESGKSNILDAIRSLDKKYQFSLRDKSKINQALPSIEFKFTFTDQEKTEIKEYITKTLAEHSFDKIEDILESIKIESFQIRKFYKKDETGYKKYSLASNDIDINIKDGYSFIIKPSIIPVDVLLPETELKLNSKSIVKTSLIPKEHLDKYIEIDGDNLKQSLLKELNSFIENKCPSVIYWEYESKYLVPSEITYEEFMKGNTPYNNSIPLYNIFILNKRLEIENEDDLAEKIIEWKADSSARRRDASIINEGLNKYIKNIWTDYDQELYIELEETKITIHINDPNSLIKNFYEMEDRSQGFKTFISFILTIAAEAETQEATNFLLLLDEPETHLHPSGVKFMRNELLKLATLDNYVIFATHSIFMIDRKNLKRHIIVKKENEQSSVTKVDKNNILQEAVIYEALGTTVDEFSIGMRNVVFEGELDILLFKFFIDKCLKKKDNRLLDYSLLDGGGTNRISKFFKDKVIPIESEWNLILDNDIPGRKLKETIKDFYPESMHNQFHFNYYSNSNGFELEDILPDEINLRSVISVLNDLKLNEIPQPTIKDFQSDKPISSVLSEFKNKNKIEGNISNQFEQMFKKSLYNEVESILTNIEKEQNIANKSAKFKKEFPEYFIFIENVLNDFKLKINDDDTLGKV